MNPVRAAEEARAINYVRISAIDWRDKSMVIGGIIFEVGVLDNHDLAP